MSELNLPLSGPVRQAFKLWVSLYAAIGSQFGLINIRRYDDPHIDAMFPTHGPILDEAASDTPASRRSP